jgi:hypothetical protein
VLVLRVFLRDASSGQERTVRALAGVVLVYWAAVMVNSSFDVYLEGPQGGIWFWSVFGIGLTIILLDHSARTCDNVRETLGSNRSNDAGPTGHVGGESV